jgi:hypothetical protein
MRKGAVWIQEKTKRFHVTMLFADYQLSRWVA